MTDAVSALIDFADPHQPDGPRLRYAFGKPREVLQAHRPDEVRPLLDAVEAAAARGAWCVGYLRYEAAAAFDPAFAVHAIHADEGPLAWFGIYDEALPSPQQESEADKVQVKWQQPLPRAAFDAALAALQGAIANGEYYQVNFTAQMEGVVSAGASCRPARDFFSALQRAQPGGYAAFIDTGGEQLLSVSPELFFDWRENLILARPMKGTAPRGTAPQDDLANAEALGTSVKERAENVMIVDLLRNDLSRIAEPFSVQVPRLFQVEALPAVWQMTSDVQARTRAGCRLADVFAALFPCGSVTGAPKVRAMRAIHALERGPRGVYCGAIGVVRPGGAATFNVPIRTVTLQGEQARCGIGSGITSGAMADGEWREWRLKQAFLQRASAPFELLETLGLFDGRLRYADEHLARMAQAAVHFGYPWNKRQLEQALEALVQQHPKGQWRVRLLLDAGGKAQAEAYALPPSPPRVRLQLAGVPLEEADSEFVRFKTTRRAHYDAFSPTDQTVFDTLLWNAAGEITECTRGNIAVLLRGVWVTPPLRCGLLAGVGRAQALREGRVREGVVRIDDLPLAEGIAFFNSLRGWLPADLVS